MLKMFWSACVLAALALPAAYSQTVWTGPNTTWTKSTANPADTILPGKVVFKRGSEKPLFNTALGETAARTGSPKGVTFAFGDISNFASLNYVTLDSLRNGNLAGVILNKPMVGHIADGDIYFSIKFTTWGTHKAGTVSYIRSTPAAVVVVPPTVTLTSPADNATFPAPANVNLTANATAGSGTLSGVSFYSGTTLLGTASAAPYNFAANNLAAGSYSFTAVATASDSGATSGVIHVTVTAPLTAITLSEPSISSGAFTFTYSADPGQSYVIQSASGPVNGSGTFDWAPVVTNTPSRSFDTFSQPLTGDHFRFFRVGRLQQ
jgi:hypothetical protein